MAPISRMWTFLAIEGLGLLALLLLFLAASCLGKGGGVPTCPREAPALTSSGPSSNHGGTCVPPKP